MSDSYSPSIQWNHLLAISDLYIFWYLVHCITTVLSSQSWFPSYLCTFGATLKHGWCLMNVWKIMLNTYYFLNTLCKPCMVYADAKMCINLEVGKHKKHCCRTDSPAVVQGVYVSKVVYVKVIPRYENVNHVVLNKLWDDWTHSMLIYLRSA